jgi:hypothetical protein
VGSCRSGELLGEGHNGQMVSSILILGESRSHILPERKKSLVKPRPQQNNRNRIVWTCRPRRNDRSARCVLHSSVAHKLRNGSPRGTMATDTRASTRQSQALLF